MPTQLNAIQAELLQALQQAREQGASYPLRVSELAELLEPAISPEEARQELVRAPLSKQVLLADKKDAQSPVVLAEDIELLANSELLLRFALEKVCSADKPLHPVPRILARVARELRPTFEANLTRQLAENALPAEVGQQTVRNKVHLFLESIPPPPPPRPPAQVLSEQLVRSLEEQQREGLAVVALSQLVQQVGFSVKASVLRQALSEEPFASRVAQLFVRKGNADTLVCLNEKAQQAISSPRATEFAVQLLSTASKPAHPVSRLLALVPEIWRDTFQQSLERFLQQGKLPETVAVVITKGKPHLHLRCHPVRLPPAEQLANQLTSRLRTCQEHGEQTYPTTLDQLLDGQPAPSDNVLRQALGKEPFKSQALVALPGQPTTPVALREDVATLADSALLLEGVLRGVRTREDQAFAVAVLQKKVSKELQTPFGVALLRRIEQARLPAGLGVLHIKKKPHLFLLQDVVPSQRGTRRAEHTMEETPQGPGLVTVLEHRPARGPSPPSEDFANRFSQAFDQLDREEGWVNFVSLVDLRRALGVERSMFDAELQKLRESGSYFLSAVEGRQGVRPEEQEAAIKEGETLLLFVSRK